LTVGGATTAAASSAEQSPENRANANKAEILNNRFIFFS